MGAYIDITWPAHKAWQQVVPNKQKLVLCPQYIDVMYDECLMAVTFGYTVPLLKKILSYSLPSEYETVMNLFSSEIDITLNNGNLVISN
jgi:hypothetical protein